MNQVITNLRLNVCGSVSSYKETVVRKPRSEYIQQKPHRHQLKSVGQHTTRISSVTLVSLSVL